MRIGIDVGGTHTDAVLLDNDTILASNKSLTSSDVASGIFSALQRLLNDSGIAKDQIEGVMIGTTQFTNAVVERRELARVAAIRIALPSGEDLPPMVDWPEDIAKVVGRHTFMLHGGFLYDGWPLASQQQDRSNNEVNDLIAQLKAQNLTNIAIASAFSPMNPAPELALAKQIQAAIPDACITLSHEIGSLGLLERENAAILNAALLPFAARVVDAFLASLAKHGLTCPMFISQNDGTLMNADFVRQFPALTFASGPTNSLRGAYKLSGLENAIVVDIGGTTADIGVLQNGFPRESHSVIKVGGVRTNFRMPDIQAIGLGGGSVVSDDGLTIGPYSVGHNLLERAKVFGGDTLTATDICVAAGYASVGESRYVADIPVNTIDNAINKMREMLDCNIEMMKPNSQPIPVILVGGGAILIQSELRSASEMVRPKNADVANAIGAAIAQIGGEAESLLSYQNIAREDAIEKVTALAKQRAQIAGAEQQSLRVAEIEETPVPYMEEGMTRIRVKVIGDIGKTKQEVSACSS